MPDNIRFFQSRHDRQATRLQPCRRSDRTGTSWFILPVSSAWIGRARWEPTPANRSSWRFENLKAALASVGAGFEHLVKINNYVVDIGVNIAQFREVRDKYVNTSAPPASTTIGVPELARPGALFEIEAVAILPA